MAEQKKGEAAQLEEANMVIGVLETKLQTLENKIAQGKTFPQVKFRTYKDKKRILVTGGAGFVGSHLVDALMMEGHQVCSFNKLISLDVLGRRPIQTFSDRPSSDICYITYISLLRFSDYIRERLNIGSMAENVYTRVIQVFVADNYFTGSKRNIEQWIGHENFEMMHHDIVNPLFIEVTSEGIMFSVHSMTLYRWMRFTTWPAPPAPRTTCTTR